MSTITYHGPKEANLKQRRPFGILVGMAAFLAVVAYHPSLVLFLVSITYVAVGLTEALYKLFKKPRQASA